MAKEQREDDDDEQDPYGAIKFGEFRKYMQNKQSHNICVFICVDNKERVKLEFNCSKGALFISMDIQIHLQVTCVE